MNRAEKPFANLGMHLRNVREQSKRSLAEVSGALEIDEQALRLIEIGQERPEEEVMLLLISYFGVQDQEALHLWELARYDSDLTDHLQFNEAGNTSDTVTQLSKPVVMMLAMDMRTLYSDGLEINQNKAGLTLNFTQTNSQNPGQPSHVSVARVGISYTQAEEVLRGLERAILHAKYLGNTKLLPPSTRKTT
jgi:transcriptional regulator with XRE-family HTH domain